MKVIATFTKKREAYEYYRKHGKPENWEIEGEEPKVKIVEYPKPYCRRILLDGKPYGVTWEQCKYILPYWFHIKYGYSLFASEPFWSDASRMWRKLPVIPCSKGKDREYIEKLYREAKKTIEREVERRKSREYEKEVEYAAKTMAERLMYPFLKAEAERHGFKTVKAYEKWKERVEREKNNFKGFYVGEWDQNNIENAVRNAVEDPAVMPRGCPDPVAFALMDYGYDFSDVRHHKGYAPVTYQGKVLFYMYPPYPSRTVREAYSLPYEDRLFPSHNYVVDREIVKAILLRRGWTFGVKGWQPPKR